jgi:hypothetical protein
MMKGIAPKFGPAAKAAPTETAPVKALTQDGQRWFIWPGTEDDARKTNFLKRDWFANVPQQAGDGFEELEEHERIVNNDGTFLLKNMVRKVSHVTMLLRNPCFSECDESGKIIDDKEHTEIVRPREFPNASQEHATTSQATQVYAD